MLFSRNLILLFTVISKQYVESSKKCKTYFSTKIIVKKNMYVSVEITIHFKPNKLTNVALILYIQKMSFVNEVSDNILIMKRIQ